MSSVVTCLGYHEHRRLHFIILIDQHCPYVLYVYRSRVVAQIAIPKMRPGLFLHGVKQQEVD